ncbi:MAG TPA: alpha/beta hydrolase [Steroidobacteraceae bacterium]|jgi:pimeloyl-ACP methyl ester carboxylesterase
MNVVLIPGLMCDQGVWGAQLAALRERSIGCSVAAHGLADSLPDMAAAVLAAQPGPFAVAGHSMGGRVALEIARQAGDRLRGAVLLDTGFRPLAPGEAGERERQGRFKLLEQAQREGIRAMATVWLRGMVHPSRLADGVLIEAILAMFERRSVAEFAAQIQALLRRPDTTALLPKIECPTLLLCGEQDQWSPPEQHREMLQLLRGGELIVVPNSGHMSPMEQPEAVSAALLAFLESIGIARRG